jgi:required for meiotic nuclear division protein 1
MNPLRMSRALRHSLGVKPANIASLSALRRPAASSLTVWSRGLSNSSGSTPPKQQKPRDSTPLRRAARDSLPIRSNPTPTRSEISQVTTLATAERYILPEMRVYLPQETERLAEAWWVPRWGMPGKEGEVFVFGNGSYVCWGLSEEEARRFGQEVVVKSGKQVGVMKEPETEELDFVTDPNECVR